MNWLIRLWPATWSRAQRSAATAAVGVALMLLVLWLMLLPLRLAPYPIGPNAERFVEGTRVTVELTLISGLAGVVLGVLAALGKLSNLAPVRWLAELYIWVMRGTPLLVQVLFVFFALPEIFPSLAQLSDFNSAVVALALNVGAYNAEAIRAGLMAVPTGQIEAARSLGMSRLDTFRDVTLPQALKVAMPPLVNNIVALLKDSSLASSIGVLELTLAGNRVKSSTFMPVQTYATLAIIYLTLTTLMTVVSNAVEHYFDIEDRRK